MSDLLFPDSDRSGDDPMKVPRRLAREGAEAAAEKAGGDWRAEYRRAFLAALDRLETVTTDDVSVPVPADADPRAIGAIVQGLARAGVIESCGWGESSESTCHARPKRIWCRRSV